MKKKLLRIFIAILFILGLGILLYPTISEWLTQWMQKGRIDTYQEQVQKLKDAECDRLFAEAQAYNEALVREDISFENIESGRETLKEQGLDYEKLLNVDNNGMMGYITIHKIDLTLPISHGQSEKVLKYGVGHLEGSSLPVGGESTHAVLFGHRGLPSAKLFTDLDQLEIGDRIEIHVLNRTLTYEVDQILVVEPEETDALQIVEGQDYVTLVTCTPYGVNSHRLLIRAIRV